MPSIGASKSLQQMDHSQEDPKEKILKELGDISGLQLGGVRVLVGTYIRPKQTKGGIILTDKYRDEDLYQGRAGLVVAMAEGAFVDGDSADTKFHGFKPKIGDWVTYGVQNGRSTLVNGCPCRLLEDVHIDGIISHPDMVL